MPRYLALVVILVLTQAGCTSMTSTMLTRDESNRFWTRKGNLKGVPITLKVPTHVQLTVFERHFLIKRPDQGVERLKLKYVVRDFAQDFIFTEKIFTVDFKRPAAGMYNLNLNLTDDQYIQSLQHDVTDQTISEVSTLVGKLVPSQGGLNAVTASAVTANLQEIQSVVAVDIFEIDSPDFEQQMTQFINCHLNQAHDAWVAPPGVADTHRTRLSGFDQQSDICGGNIIPDPLRSAVNGTVPQTILRQPASAMPVMMPGTGPLPKP